MNTLRKRLVAFVLSASIVMVPLFVACSNNAEGERCDQLSSNGGNDDCQDGLICTSKTDLNGASSDLCCPQNRTTATTPQCQIAHAPVGGDAAPPPPSDSGSTGDAAGDTGAQSDADAASEASDAADGG